MGVTQKVDCGTCGGSGVMKVGVFGPRHRGRGALPCPVCGATGEVTVLYRLAGLIHEHRDIPRTRAEIIACDVLTRGRIEPADRDLIGEPMAEAIEQWMAS